MTYISWSSSFALIILKTIWWTKFNWNIGSMWCKDFLHKMYVRQWPTFHGPVILSYTLTFWWRIVVLTIYWFSATLGLTYKYICVVSDLYFVVQWFCLISSILFDEQASFFGFGSVWYGLLTCISWFSDFESFTYFCLLWFVEVWYANICECSKVRGQLLTQGTRQGNPCSNFGHTSSFLRSL